MTAKKKKKSSSRSFFGVPATRRRPKAPETGDFPLFTHFAPFTRFPHFPSLRRDRKPFRMSAPKKPSPAFLELQEKAKNALADARRVVAPLRRRLSFNLRSAYDHLATLCQAVLQARPGEISVARLNKKIDDAVADFGFETNPSRLGVNALLAGEATFATQPSADGETIYAYLVNADGDPIRGTEDLASGKLVEPPQSPTNPEPEPPLETLDDLCAFFEIERPTFAKKPTPAFLRLQNDAEAALRRAVEKLRNRFGYVPKPTDAFDKLAIALFSYLHLWVVCKEILSAQPGEIKVAEERRRLERQRQKFNEENDLVYRALKELENGRAKLGAVLDETGKRWVGRVVLSNGEEVREFRELFQAPLFENQNVFADAAAVVAQILRTFDGKSVLIGTILREICSYSLTVKRESADELEKTRFVLLADKDDDASEPGAIAIPKAVVPTFTCDLFVLGSPALYVQSYQTFTESGNSKTERYVSATFLTYLPFDFLRAAYKAQFDAYEAALAQEFPA